MAWACNRGHPGRSEHLSFEVKYGAQRDVALHEFLRVQAGREVTEALRVDGGGLLDQYPDTDFQCVPDRAGGAGAVGRENREVPLGDLRPQSGSR